MQCLRSAICLAVLLASLPMAQAGGLTARQLREQWNGSWTVSQSFNELLGFDQKSRLDAALDHPTAFQLKVQKKDSESRPSEALDHFKTLIAQHLNHEVVARGEWETRFEVEPGIETDCLITEHEGATYLWVAAPYIGVYGGKVSFIRGIDASHDVMVIDFNPTMSVRSTSNRTPDTVAYKRVVKSDAATDTNGQSGDES